MRKIELLAPARNMETGIAAINHGADAVYIGAEKFGARAAASNSIEDIKKLIRHAHLYNAKVFAAVNTILYDNELEDAAELIKVLYESGIDAVIIQDMGILEMDIPPVALHASTQTDNCDIQRVKFLDKAGFRRIVLARELSLRQIKDIRQQTECELEFFIHGALCVSLSGRCYMSAASGGRSANRGECAQPCRKSYTLTDAEGKIISNRKYPLSLKDMNQAENIGDLIEAGISSLKIEGRLKDINYVKNVTLHYRKILDDFLEGKIDVMKASSGKVYPGFSPDPERTFSRGFTDYFLRGRRSPVTSPDTPKSTGKLLGTVTGTGDNWFTTDSGVQINNGDGLVFFDMENNLTGIKVNRADSGRIYPLSMNGIHVNARVYRNFDAAFEKMLSAEKTERRIDVSVEFSETAEGYKLTLTDEDGNSATAETGTMKELSRSQAPQHEQISIQLAKLGGTIFKAAAITISLAKNYFLPVSLLNELRRNAAEKLTEARISGYRITHHKINTGDIPYPYKKIDYRHNVSNRLAEKFYRRHGVEEIEKSFETSGARITGPVMTTKLCIRHENMLCPKQGGIASKFREPFYLIDGNIKYRVEFDCKDCFMLVFKD